MALLGLILFPLGMVLTAGQYIYYYTLTKNYCKCFSARYSTSQGDVHKSDLAELERLISMPSEVLNTMKSL